MFNVELDNRNMAMLNTHTLVKNLVSAGLAETIAAIISDAILFTTKEHTENLEKEQVEIKTDLEVISRTGATRTDIIEMRSELKDEMSEIKSVMSTKVDIAAVRNEMSEMKAELKGEMSEMKAELKAEMSEMKAEMSTKVDIAAVRNEMSEMKAELKAEMVTKVELNAVNSEIAMLIKEISQFKTDIIKWMVSFFVTTIAIIIGLHFKQ